MARQRKIKHYRSGFMSRKRKRMKILKTVVFILVLAALIFVGYSVAQSISRLNDPNYRPESSSSENAPLPSEDNGLSGENPDGSASEPEDPSSEPEPQNTASDIRSILLPFDSMTSLDAAEAFLQTVDKTLYNSVTVELKNEAGRIFYPSQVELAQTCGALSETQIDQKALAELIEQYGFTPVARIYALQDDYASHASYSTSYLYENQSSVTWLDNSADAGGKSWLNPYMENAANYLNAIVTEIAESGYKAIVVNGIQYPNTANQRGMGLGPNADSMTTQEALEQIYTGMSNAAKAFDVPVIPAYRGECYKGERPQVYTVNPNEFTFYPASPVVGSDLTVLDAVTAPAEDLIPTIDSEDQIASLRERGIEQYLVG